MASLVVDSKREHVQAYDGQQVINHLSETVKKISMEIIKAIIADFKMTPQDMQQKYVAEKRENVSEPVQKLYEKVMEAVKEQLGTNPVIMNKFSSMPDKGEAVYLHFGLTATRELADNIGQEAINDLIKPPKPIDVVSNPRVTLEDLKTIDGALKSGKLPTLSDARKQDIEEDLKELNTYTGEMTEEMRERQGLLLAIKLNLPHIIVPYLK